MECEVNMDEGIKEISAHKRLKRMYSLLEEKKSLEKQIDHLKDSANTIINSKPEDIKCGSILFDSDYSCKIAVKGTPQMRRDIILFTVNLLEAKLIDICEELDAAELAIAEYRPAKADFK